MTLFLSSMIALAAPTYPNSAAGLVQQVKAARAQGGEGAKQLFCLEDPAPFLKKVLDERGAAGTIAGYQRAHPECADFSKSLRYLDRFPDMSVVPVFIGMSSMKNKGPTTHERRLLYTLIGDAQLYKLAFSAEGGSVYHLRYFVHVDGRFRFLRNLDDHVPPF